MDEREELARLIGETAYEVGDEWENIPGYLRDHCEWQSDHIIAARYRRIPKPGSAEWMAMVERARKAYFAEGNRTSFDAALRAALGLDQPHRENDERPEEQPRDAG